MAYDLTAIISSVRELIKSESTNQITDAKIVDYINAFYLYNLPEELQCLKLTKNLRFYTIPNRDTYDLKTIPTSPGTTDILNTYLTFNDPVYINGRLSRYYQNREMFLADYDYVEVTSKLGTGKYAAARICSAAASLILTVLGMT